MKYVYGIRCYTYSTWYSESHPLSCLPDNEYQVYIVSFEFFASILDIKVTYVANLKLSSNN